ncbi:MAG TPA: hypothetical protein VMU05_18150 [Dongiaceae bacterium]|nr:hypothetical protein [Dongiaceae bacterium]
MEREGKRVQRHWREIAFDVLVNADSDRLHALLLELLEAINTQVLPEPFEAGSETVSKAPADWIQ